nr:hypothetical protein [Mycobacterium numidiamassiliense]
MAYVRTVKTSSGATAVQIVWSTADHLFEGRSAVGRTVRDL